MMAMDIASATKIIPSGDCRKIKLKPQKFIKRTRRRRLDQIETAVKSLIADKKLTLFACVACENLLKQPVTVKCGHTFCLECIEEETCPKCFMVNEEVPLRVDILVQSLIEKWKERNKIGDIGEKALRKSWNCITAEELECLLCRRSLFDPVTTPCGHTFCR
ncbi:unnamed protein product [Ceutorhynchus assimilis]|uniref:RING-type domain-containing protein n=1 Tax=Ceutorhynchus assimilis TaxID=467358 RepID=A0A9N9MGA6_9CUCU|nr:unnamed protein product [Ceutorhynchus assimilis]